MRLSTKLYCENKFYFHINGFALSLIFKQRLAATREWPTEVTGLSIVDWSCTGSFEIPAHSSFQNFGQLQPAWPGAHLSMAGLLKGEGGGWEIEVHQKTIVTQGRREGNYLTCTYLCTLDKLIAPTTEDRQAFALGHNLSTDPSHQDQSCCREYFTISRDCPVIQSDRSIPNQYTCDQAVLSCFSTPRPQFLDA